MKRFSKATINDLIRQAHIAGFRQGYNAATQIVETVGNDGEERYDTTYGVEVYLSALDLSRKKAIRSYGLPPAIA